MLKVVIQICDSKVRGGFSNDEACRPELPCVLGKPESENCSGPKLRSEVASLILPALDLTHGSHGSYFKSLQARIYLQMVPLVRHQAVLRSHSSSQK
jgi:hypothetical protein